jgi:hypothetical protein
MVTIKPDCQFNALGMLRSKPGYFIGQIGEVRYYVVDGKAWSLDAKGRIARSDSPAETRRIVRMVRELNKGATS